VATALALFFDVQGEHDPLKRWVGTTTDEAWAEKRYRSKALSIDGLPGLMPPAAASLRGDQKI
jgi:hypothetical protein